MGNSVEDKYDKGRKNPPNPKKTAGVKKPERRSVRKKNATRGSSHDTIAKSRQLLNRMSDRSDQSPRPKRSRTSAPSAPRVCGNGMPMPSLAELERMYDDDSDDDDSNAANAASTTAQPKHPPERCKTPDIPLVLSEDKLTSPTTLKVIGSKIMDLISNMPVITIDDNQPRPPVIPQKKRKKSDTPYIVGCKEREQVPWAPKTNFCVGDTKYGVEQPGPSSSDDDDENSNPKKRRRSGTANISKSIFNPKSEEIASWLKQSEQFDAEISNLNNGAQERKRSSSIDSNKTVDYRFSPLPSTSRDNDTFLKNDQLFNESLHSSNINNAETESDNEIEIVDAPVETIEINDTLPIRNIEPINHSDDDCCVIVEPPPLPPPENTEMETSIINIDSPNDNGYGSLDFNLNLDNSDCEIIDVDDLLAESQAIIAKYQKREGLDSVTVVDPGRSYAPKAGNASTAAPVPMPMEITENNPITSPENTSSVIAIEDVVTNFFVNHNTSSSSAAVDLTGSPLPRDLTTWLSSLPPNNNFNSNNQNVQPVTLTISSTSAPVLPPPPSIANARAANLVNTGMSPNRNRNRQNRVPPAIRVLQVMPQVNRVLQANRLLTGGPPPFHSPAQHPPVNIVPPATPVVVPPRPVEQCVTPNPAGEYPPRNLSRNLGDCPICMENLSNGEIASTICGHIFCMDCIKAAIRTNKRCPSCRKTLNAKGYHKLFL